MCGLHSNFMLKYLSTTYTVFFECRTMLRPYQQYTRASVSLYFYQYPLLSVFLINVILVGEVVSHCSFLCLFGV